MNYDSDGESQVSFYAELHTPESIKANYAPEGKCLSCGAKLSRYRPKSYGEYDQYCAPCQHDDLHLNRYCKSCGESYSNHGGDRKFCARCVVPSFRIERSQEALIKAEKAHKLSQQNVPLPEIANLLEFKDGIEVGRFIKFYSDGMFLAQEDSNEKSTE